MTQEENEEEMQTDPHQGGLLCRVCVGGLRYLCVRLVVLAVISGGVGTVRRCSRRCRAVSEGAGALGGHGSSWRAVDP